MAEDESERGELEDQVLRDFYESEYRKAEELARASAPPEFRPSVAYLGADGGLQQPLPVLAADIADQYRITGGPGGGLWYNAGGVYRSGAEAFIKDAVRGTLRRAFKSHHLNEVMTWCKTLPVTIRADVYPPEGQLNLANGVLDLTTLELRPLGDDKFTYRVPVAWQPSAECPRIEAFVREVVPADCVPLVAEVLGMCLLTTSRFRRAVMLLGSGNNGKSVFLNLASAMLGDENVSNHTLHKLAEDRFAVAALVGKLANICGDLDARPLERSDFFKMLVGGDTIPAERKYQDGFSFRNYATLVFSANEWPATYDQSDAYFGRWIAIPFTQKYREDDGPLEDGERRANPKLLAELATEDELRGLLVRAVAGARRLRERGGFKVPESVRASLTEYRQWADTVRAWADDCVTADDGTAVRRADVYGSYKNWVTENGQHPISAKAFWPRFRDVLARQGIPVREYKAGDRMIVGVLVRL